MRPGSTGQFDVFVDGELVASRTKNILLRAMGRGFPDEGDVVEAVATRIGAGARGTG